jgi:hypothetical protein
MTQPSRLIGMHIRDIDASTPDPLRGHLFGMVDFFIRRLAIEIPNDVAAFMLWTNHVQECGATRSRIRRRQRPVRKDRNQ